MNRKSKSTRAFFSVAIVVTWVALCLMTVVRPVSANTFTVTNTGDNGGVNPAPGAGTGTLRQAIIDANANAGADTINFAAGVTGTITLGSALPQITQNLTINGPGAGVLTVSGNHLYRVFQITGVTVSISGLTISSGDSGAGGGIFNDGGTLTVTNCTLSGNQAFLSGGGGIFNNGISGGGLLTVTNCTFSGNSSNTAGGIHNSGGTATVTNSTFSGNFGVAGGIGNTGGALLTVTNSTFSGNSGTTGGGGGIVNSGTATLKNSIIANSPSGGNCAGTVAITAVGVNFSTDNTCAGFTQVTAAQLNLGPLANNGGPTFTLALLPSSVAIDAVTDCTDLSAMPAPVTTDQRGNPRPADGDGNGSALCDAGAFEVQPCSITCPANITKSNDPNQCGAFVSYPPPTTAGDNCGTITCSPPSGSFFSKGTTTVNCDASGTTANPDCSFTVTVNDTQPPTITCPANVTAVSAVACPPTTSTVVTFPAPTASDNCPGVTVACVPPSGSTFPAGTTTVTCTATDTSANTSSCSFSVSVFSGRLQDDSNPKNVLLFNFTGDYALCCGGMVFTGKGTGVLKGCLFTLQDNPADRRLLVNVDFSQKRGTASLQFPPGTIKCTIIDRNMADDTSTCP